MPDFLLGFGIVAIVLSVTPLASGLVERSPLSFPVIFLGLGFLLGQRGLDVVQIGAHDPVLEIVATLTLALVLFLDAVKLQIIVMYILIGAAAFTGLAAVLLTYRRFFTANQQLVLPSS